MELRRRGVVTLNVKHKAGYDEEVYGIVAQLAPDFEQLW
jgi:hypothetical protein